jgi:3-hydroxyisobutyrate dehydrogenase-like beta-hydroxyacid dehydrogenase
VTVVALLHPGAMGSRIGGELVATGHEVRWLATGRSDATHARARTEGLAQVDDAVPLVDRADVVFSVLAPQHAVDAARLVAATGFAGTYVDANPLSPATLAVVREAVEATGATFVDAGVVGPPPRAGGRTHLYLAGQSGPVAEVVRLVHGTRITPVVVGERVGQASAAKQAYALANKGRMVLVSLAAEIARTHGVEQVLEGESVRPGGELLADLDDLVEGLGSTGWRWAPELDEIAATLAAAGVDPAAVAALADRLRAMFELRRP